MESNDLLGFLAVADILTIRLEVVNKQGTTDGEIDSTSQENIKTEARTRDVYLVFVGMSVRALASRN